MAVNYGSTGQSAVRLNSANMGPYDDDNEDEYDYLPCPEVDEDFFDDDDAADTHRVPKRIPFDRIHEDPVPFDSLSRHCFLPGQRITVKIVEVEQSSYAQLLKSNLYVIHVTHGEYKWTLRQRHKHFRSLHDSLILVRAKAMLSRPSKETQRSVAYTKKQNVPKFPKRPDPLIRGDNLDTRKGQLEAYLQAIVKYPQFRNNPEMLQFLEVSHLSFVNGLGPKLKEGLVEKRAGGRKFGLACCMCCQPGRWQKRWLLLKDSYIAYIRPQDGSIRDVLLMDSSFSVQSGLSQTGFRYGLLISNLSRNLLLKCWTDRKNDDWYDAIQQVVKGSGGEYVEKNRYESFAPVRINSYVNWFVDGASYMAAVADGLEAAKEEIFICDWMLSPELCMKRPAIEGDKWRLDKILERKANEGVKVFILLYKEMEMALGISSYYSKSTLTKLNPKNIKIMRHPDGIKLWSHHEKCVVIDQRIAFLGGIDLCYGRWDTRSHRLSDLAQTQLTQFYGREDFDTLKNLLFRIPNAVPTSYDSISNNEANDTKALQQQQQSGSRRALPSITEGSDDCETRDQCMSTIHRDPDGGYVNRAVLKDAMNNDHGVDDVTGRMAPHGDDVTGRMAPNGDAVSSHNKSSLGVLLKSMKSNSTGSQHNHTVGEDGDTDQVPVDGDVTPKSDDELVRRTTLQSFLEMVRSRPKEIIDRLNTDNIRTSDEEDVQHEADKSTDQPDNPVSTSTTNLESALQNNLKESTESLHLTDGQKAAMFGVQQNGAKPVTPKLKVKGGEKMKSIVDVRMMFHKLRPESIDVTNDAATRPWDDSVYMAKEQDKDAHFDAELARKGLCGPLKIWVGKDYVNFIFKDFVELDNPFTDMVDRTVTPRMPWHDIAAGVFGKPARDVARHFIQRWNFTKLEKKKASVDIPMLLPKSNSVVSVPRWVSKSAFNCNCQILRSSSTWSAGISTTENSIYRAYIDLISKAKHFIYIENQFFISIDNNSVVRNQIGTALYERILQAHRSNQSFRVFVVLPLLPAFEGEIGTTTGTSIQAVVHWNYSSICRGGKSLLERLIAKGVMNPFKYISFCGLRKHEEMCGVLKTELVYVHSKMMIVDDCSVIIASANINDRSMIGNRDSELGILVQDTHFVDSLMNGQPYKAGAFACSLRKSLFREHLGVNVENPYVDITDPVSVEFYENVWLRQASINTAIYEDVFSCIPTDAVRTLSELREYQNRPVMADEKPDEARQKLRRIKGYLVFLPLQFLAGENLVPATGTKEALAPTIVWT